AERAGAGLAAAGELRALLGPDAAGAGERPRRPHIGVVGGAADKGGVAIGRQRHAPAEPAGAGLAAAGELRALLGPDAAGAGERPGRAHIGVVGGAADQGGVAIGGQRHALAEQAGAGLAAAGQLRALLDEWVDPERIARAAI